MTAISEFSLRQNFRKEKPNHPYFRDKVTISGTPYHIAAWLGEVTRGANAGSRYLSIQFQNEVDPNDKTTVSIWQKQNRKQPSDAHFCVDESFRGQQCSFSAWIIESGGSHELKVSITPPGKELSQEALSAQKRIQDFLKLAATQESESFPPSIAGAGDARDNEPNNIPF